MNRIIRSRFSGIAVVLLFPLVFLGCSTCDDTCAFLSLPCLPGGSLFVMCWAACMSMCSGQQISSDCTEHSDECAATFEQMQTLAIQFCEEYPEECQEYFDVWVESFDTDAEE